MDWDDIKQSIVEDLESRNLKDASIRIRALKSVDGILISHIMKLLDNPTTFIELFTKEDFKLLLATYKLNERLNGAEESVVNEIYKRLL
jgi:hypothetical protein